MNIYEKMLKATEKIGSVAKNLEVGNGKNQYKAVGELDVLKAVKPIEVELGIYSYPLSREIIDTNTFTTTSEYQGKVTERNNLFMRLKTVYRFVNTEKPEDYIDITTYGDGVDSQDKAPGKAMTYSDKYALLKAYKIGTGDDPDQNPSENGRFNKKTKEDKPKGEKEQEETENMQIDKNYAKALTALADRKRVPIKQICDRYKVATVGVLTMKQFCEAKAMLEKMPDKKQQDLGLK